MCCLSPPQQRKWCCHLIMVPFLQQLTVLKSAVYIVDIGQLGRLHVCDLVRACCLTITLPDIFVLIFLGFTDILKCRQRCVDRLSQWCLLPGHPKNAGKFDVNERTLGQLFLERDAGPHDDTSAGTSALISNKDLKIRCPAVLCDSQVYRVYRSNYLFIPQVTNLHFDVSWWFCRHGCWVVCCHSQSLKMQFTVRANS